GIPLKIAGDGPLAADVAEAVRHMPDAEWLGRLSPDATAAAMRDAALLIFPSEWYEGLPRTIVESFAAGTPVVTSKLGAMRDLIRDGQTGLHFQPGDAEDMARVVAGAFAHPIDLAGMRSAARAEFEARYTAEANYRQLLEIYAQV